MENVSDARLEALCKERDELMIKLMKLEDFLSTGKAEKLSETARKLLIEQQYYMEQYARILINRIRVYEEEKAVK